jgi:Holliday junction DNA helicase RuvA
MIATLTGVLLEAEPVPVIGVGGLGLRVHVPSSLPLGRPGDEIVVHTHLCVREDSLTLYGFATRFERDAFVLLLGVNGVGPRLALAVLSKLPGPDLAEAVRAGAVARLITVPGVGRKTAQRMLLDLKDRIGRLEGAGPPAPSHPRAAGAAGVQEEAALALVNLGLTRPAADDALARVSVSEVDAGAGVEEWVRAALRRSRL